MSIKERLQKLLDRYSISLLFWAFGIIYFWYGLLKIADMSPIEQLLRESTFWLGHQFDIILGIWEAGIGFCFFIPRVRKIGLILLFLQFPGTFLPFVMSPEDCFQIFPYALTLEGQYIMKNLILIAASLVLLSSTLKKKSL